MSTTIQQPLTQFKITKREAILILEKLLGEKPLHIVKLNNGITNKVFKAYVKGEKNLVIRISDVPDKINDYLKEQWCTKNARELGVPVPRILEVGNTVLPYPYMVLEEELGLEGNNYGADKTDIYRQMGEMAAKINSINTTSFGRVFDWSDNVLSKNPTWVEYLDKELKANYIYNLFETNNILNKDNLKKFRSIIDEIYKWNVSPKLNHSDIRLKNLLIDKQGKITVLLDWENAIATAAPYWELSTCLIDLKEADRILMLEGYGMSLKEFKQKEKYIFIFDVFNYRFGVEDFVKNNNQDELKRFRLLLNNYVGAFN